MHFANRILPPLFAEHVAGILQSKGLFADQPVSAWFSSRSVLLRVVQDAWYRYLAKQGVTGYRVSEPAPPDYAPKIDVPFDHSDVRAIVDSMFLDGTLHPLAVHGVPADLPNGIKAGIVKDPAAFQDLVVEGIKSLTAGMPTDASSHRDWSEFARHYGEILSRFHTLDNYQSSVMHDSMTAMQRLSDKRLQPWVAAKHYGDLPSLPVTKGPVMVHHVPRFLAIVAPPAKRKLRFSFSTVSHSTNGCRFANG